MIYGVDRDVIESINLLETKISNRTDCLRYDYRGLEVLYYPDSKKLSISGSIHKYWNKINGNGWQNHNDFSYMNAYNALKSLSKAFSTPLDKMNVKSAEYGLNINTIKSPMEIITSNIKYYRKPLKKDTVEYFNIGHDGCLHSFEMSNHTIKFYDKGRQCKRPVNILRYEIRERGSTRLKLGNSTDLFRLETIERLKKELLEKFNNCLIADNIDWNRIDNKIDHDKLKDYINPVYWKTLREKARETNQRTQFRRKWNDANKILAKYDLLKIRDELRSKIESKFDGLASELPDINNVRNTKSVTNLQNCEADEQNTKTEKVLRIHYSKVLKRNISLISIIAIFGIKKIFSVFRRILLRNIEKLFRKVN
ncbi:hypothetical protein [Membranihabitans maritimus]|uniref:hypothetical protein n=1 Tax=Membranihabitans maritimus TaxID=2904244 RepID=UPI001F368D22|nr:hypothetical protein [Membranihabitans maritimus]